MDSFQFVCEGLQCYDEQEAWDSFKKNLRNYFYWINGYKAWRSAPRLYKDKDIRIQKTIFLVKARVIAFKEIPEGFIEATIDGPYPVIEDPFVSQVGLGLMPKKDKEPPQA